MVAMSRRERMVAHDIADAPFLLAVVVRCRTFFQENFVDRVFRDVIERCANQRSRGEAMSRGGSFDRLGAGLEFHVGWRKRREVGLSSTGRARAASGTRTRRPQHPGIEPGIPQWCRARRRWQSAVRKGFFNGTDVVSIAAPPRCPVEIACNQVDMFTKHHGTDCEDELFRNTPFFGVDIFNMYQQICECFLAAQGSSTKRGTRKYPLQNPSQVSFHHFIRQLAPGIMEVNGLDFDIRVEGVFVEKHSASSIISHTESIRKKFKINKINYFLQCYTVPLACDFFPKSTFFSASGSWIPVVDAEPFCNG